MSETAAQRCLLGSNRMGRLQIAGPCQSEEPAAVSGAAGAAAARGGTRRRGGRPAACSAHSAVDDRAFAISPRTAASRLSPSTWQPRRASCTRPLSGLPSSILASAPTSRVKTRSRSGGRGGPGPSAGPRSRGSSAARRRSSCPRATDSTCAGVSPTWSAQRIATIAAAAGGDVASEQDPARRHERKECEVVGWVPPGGVEEQARMVGEPPPDPGEVGDGEVREHDGRLGIALAERQRVAAERGESRDRSGRSPTACARRRPRAPPGRRDDAGRTAPPGIRCRTPGRSAPGRRSPGNRRHVCEDRTRAGALIRP
jgi:hypothetical protein